VQLRRCLALGLVSLLALTACSSSGGNEDLEQRVEELEQRLAEATSTTAATDTTTTTITSTTTTIPTTTSEVTADGASAGWWETRFPEFEYEFNYEVSNEAEAWCRARPEEVLAQFTDMYPFAGVEEHWQLAMSMLEDVDYDVNAWRQDDKYDNGFWAWRQACDMAHAIANMPPVNPLFTVEVSQAAALWCSTRPDEVLAAFAALHEANNTGDLINDPWTVAGLVLSQVDYDVDAWRNLEKFEVGSWAWRASCQVAYDSR
jgi:hypothetical protein